MYKIDVGVELMCKKPLNNNYVLGDYYTITYKFPQMKQSIKSFFIKNDIFTTSKFHGYYIFDYFYTKQDERKIKLQIIKLKQKCIKNERV